ncbi:MAG: hypothetical protein IPK50_12870 [Fibrobacterota bacterium]|nr:MAG: hypothetical protein IPK50_12870 [Fibrobacterota bacterium]
MHLYCESLYEGRALFDLHELSSLSFPELDMFEIYSNRRFRAGKWYTCPADAFSVMYSTAIRGEKFPFFEDEGKDVRIESEAWPDPYFFKFFPEHSGFEPHEDQVYDRAEIYAAGDGNAVRVFCSEDPHKIPDIWFDYGCGNHADINTVASALESNRMGGELIIISHWDLDHSNCLAHLGKPVKELIASNGMPKTARRMGIEKRLNSLGIEIKTLGVGKIAGKLELSPCRFGNAELWIPFPSKSRNKSSYVMLIKNKDSLLLSGDQHYAPICSSITPNAINNFLIPHHGGHAGKEPSNLSTFLSGSTMISCSHQKRSKRVGAISWLTISASRPSYTYLNHPSISISY